MGCSISFSPKLAGTFAPTGFLYTMRLNSFDSDCNELEAKYPSFTTYGLAMRKQFWHRKGSLVLVATNFFSEYVNLPTVLYGTNFTTNTSAISFAGQ